MSADPQPRTVLGLAEVVLWTRNMDKTMEFYRDLFGLELISEPDFQAKFLSAGVQPSGIPGMIVLMPHPPEADEFPPEKTKRVLHHLAFAVDPHRYDELQDRCRDYGLAIRLGIHPVLKGVRTFYVDDPEGNEVEIIGKELGGTRKFAEG